MDIVNTRWTSSTLRHHHQQCRRYPPGPDVEAAALAASACLDYWLAQELGIDDQPVPSAVLQLEPEVGPPMEGAFKTKHCTRLLWALMQVNHKYVLGACVSVDHKKRNSVLCCVCARLLRNDARALNDHVRMSVSGLVSFHRAVVLSTRC